MDENNFTEEDKEKLVEFLNLVAKYAKFEMNTGEIIKYFKALSFMQQQLIPKVDSHILEVKKVVQPKEKEKKGKK